MADKDRMLAEFHEWNEEMSGNENQEICKHRMQGWKARGEHDRQRIAGLEFALANSEGRNADRAKQIEALRDLISAAPTYKKED